MGATPEPQRAFLADPVHEDHEDLEHTPVEMRDVVPVLMRVVMLGKAALGAGGWNKKHPSAVLGGQERQLRLRGIVAQQHARPGVWLDGKRPPRRSGREVVPLL